MSKVKCPVCGGYEFEYDFDSCEVCYWQHDRVQEDDPDFWGGANDESLNDYKAAWEAQKPKSQRAVV